MVPTGKHELSWSEPVVDEALIDQDVVAAAVGDDQVLDAVAVEVGQRDGAGVPQARGAIAQHGRLTPAVIDDHAVQALVGEDEILGAVAREVGHSQ